MSPRNRKLGFTLPELMPGYAHYSSRAHQLEAKTSLAHIYLVEKSYFAENITFSNCLRQIGGFPVNLTGRRFYMVGEEHVGLLPNICGPDGLSDCEAYHWTPLTLCNMSCIDYDAGTDDAGSPPNAKVGTNALLLNNCANIVAIGVPATWWASQFKFTYGAVGNITSRTAYDMWTIDQDRQLLQLQDGL